VIHGYQKGNREEFHIPLKYAAEKKKKSQNVHHAAGTDGTGIHILPCKNINRRKQPNQKTCKQPSENKNSVGKNRIKLKQQEHQHCDWKRICQQMPHITMQKRGKNDTLQPCRNQRNDGSCTIPKKSMNLKVVYYPHHGNHETRIQDGLRGN